MQPCLTMVCWHADKPLKTDAELVGTGRLHCCEQDWSLAWPVPLRFLRNGIFLFECQNLLCRALVSMSVRQTKGGSEIELKPHQKRIVDMDLQPIQRQHRRRQLRRGQVAGTTSGAGPSAGVGGEVEGRAPFSSVISDHGVRYGSLSWLAILRPAPRPIQIHDCDSVHMQLPHDSDHGFGGLSLSHALQELTAATIATYRALHTNA